MENLPRPLAIFSAVVSIFLAVGWLLATLEKMPYSPDPFEPALAVFSTTTFFTGLLWMYSLRQKKTLATINPDETTLNHEIKKHPITITEPNVGVSKQLGFRLSDCPHNDKTVCFLYFGKCTQSPNVESEMWFVTIVRGIYSGIGNRDDQWRLPKEDYTFLVGKEHARPSYFNEFRRDVNKWKTVSYKEFVGAWCVKYEMLWKDIPIFQHTLSNGKRVKYGYCRTQERSGSRELWYIAFESGATFVVDHILANIPIIERMGDDELKWTIVCWCKLEHEVVWDELVEGKLTGGYVRSITGFSLDSPYLPFQLSSIEARISFYEHHVPEIERSHPNITWEELSEWQKGRYLSRFLPKLPY